MMRTPEKGASNSHKAQKAIFVIPQGDNQNFLKLLVTLVFSFISAFCNKGSCMLM